MITDWKYIENQFTTATRDNLKKALKLSNYHDAALSKLKDEDPAWLPIYTRYHPMHVEYVQKYNLWKSAGGAQEGETLNVEQLLKTSYEKIYDWDLDIQKQYKKTTPRYKSIFPNGRKPFYQGSIDEQINAYNTLSQNIGADATLATVRAEVDTTYGELDAARDKQEAAKGSTKGESGNVDTAARHVMIMQYRNMAFTLDNYYNERDAYCNRIFDLPLLRNLEQKKFTGTLDINEVEPVLIHTFAEDDEIWLSAQPAYPVEFYLATTPGGNNSTALVVKTAEVSKITAADFGITNYGTHRYLTAVNVSGAETHYVVELK